MRTQRATSGLRTTQVQRAYTKNAPGSVLIALGNTSVLCTASIESRVPPWMAGKGKGWLTAEYNMLPGSTTPRKSRDRGGSVDGRTTEIQRLIGRSLRAILDLEAIGERMISVDCDVLNADGGTRTTSITGAFLALVDAIASLPQAESMLSPFRDSVAAVSVGIVNGQPVLDLDYDEDFAATVDMNVVMTGKGRYIEIQGTGEEATFDDHELQALLGLARTGIGELTRWQEQVLGSAWPFTNGNC